MKVVVIGAAGMLGRAVVVRMKQAGDVTPIHRTHPTALGRSLDLRDRSALEDIVRTKPDWIVNCAANTDVDWCESNPLEASRINSEVPSRLAAMASGLHVRVLQISTDSVFDGERGLYEETDPPRPLNVYASTKLSGEDGVLRVSAENLVIRMNIIGFRSGERPALVESILRVLKSGGLMRGFTDAVFSPLRVATVADIVAQCMESGLAGLYHAGSADAISKFDFARQLAVEFGADPRQVEPGLTSEHAFKARRPRNTSLVSQRLAKALGIELPSVSEEIVRLRQDPAAAGWL